MNDLFNKIDECILEQEYNATIYNEDLICVLKQCKLEIQRLLDGRFTEEEFQNLCHNLSTDDRCRFEQGCKEYQNKLFGKENIPEGVYWNVDSCNFYNTETKIGMGLEFYDKWYHRKDEFEQAYGWSNKDARKYLESEKEFSVFYSPPTPGLSPLSGSIINLTVNPTSGYLPTEEYIEYLSCSGGGEIIRKIRTNYTPSEEKPEIGYIDPHYPSDGVRLSSYEQELQRIKEGKRRIDE